MQRESVPGPVDLHVRAFHVRAVRDEAREADFICSTDAIDRYGERVEQATWRLDDYLKNPVCLFAHQSRELPIGQAKNVGVVDGMLQATIAFSDKHQLARDVWELVKERTLRAVSVGFIPHTYRVEKENDADVLVLADCELVELSVTPIPANPEALAKARAKAFQQAAAAITAVSEGTDMSLEDKVKALEATILQREADVRVAEKRASEAETKTKALEQQNEHLVKERDAANAAREIAETKLLELEVGTLVGVKISKDEKDSFVRLARLDRKLFDQMVSQRSDLPAARDLTGTGPVVSAADPTPPAIRSAAGDNGAALEAAIQKVMEA